MALGYIRPSVAAIEQQQIVAVSDLALGDPSVIAMWYGESDLITDQDIRQASIDSLNAGETFYGRKRGLAELQDALASYMGNLYGVPIDPERVTVTASGMAGIMLVCQAILEPGDNAIVVGPVWPNAEAAVRTLAAEPRFCQLDNDPVKGWSLDVTKLEQMIDDRTRFLFINSPNNPTGWTAPASLITDLLEMAKRKGIWIIADEVYARMVYEGQAAPSFLEQAQPDDPVIVINSFSKSWAMTGWRVGWITHPPELGALFGNLIEFNFSCLPTFVQRGALQAIQDGERAAGQITEYCRQGRDIVSQRLPVMKGITNYRPPEASFYAFFQIPGTEDRTFDVCRELVQRYKVGIAPGTAFGPGAEGWYRLCFAQSLPKLREGLDRLERGLGEMF